MYLRICGVLRLQKNNWLRKSRKLYGPQIANPQIAVFAASSANIKQMLSANLRICYLRNLVADSPPLEIC
jgi:hypothetical protein